MAIIHRFFDELVSIENDQLFCNEPIATKSKLLVIGTFNPDNNSCEKINNATWFYGRRQNKFWKYLPPALTGHSLHQSNGHVENPQSWKTYCVKNKIVIIDLIKRININDVLPNFGDREVEYKINFDTSNTDYFDINRAFKKIQFEKVIYSLTWSDAKINRLRTCLGFEKG